MVYTQNNYELAALNIAFALCKKISIAPESCTKSTNNCEEFIHGLSTKPAWRCAAVDGKAQEWKSRFILSGKMLL